MDAVVHLAAIVGDPACARQPDLAREVNLNATLELLEECDRQGVSRFIFASTCSNYGRMTGAETYVDESTALNPVSLYAETKVAVERAVLTSTAGTCKTLLRFATVFGVSPRMRFDLTVNEFTLDLLTKKHLTVYGEQFWRPYIHVRDAARAIELVLRSPVAKIRNEVFNAGSTDENYQKQQLVELIRAYEPDARVEFIHRDEDPRDYRVSFAKISSQLGFDATLRVPDGIAEVARLIKQGLLADFDSPVYRN
jgi:nucleoside-diphosphate-sugar epimerase